MAQHLPVADDISALIFRLEAHLMESDRPEAREAAINTLFAISSHTTPETIATVIAPMLCPLLVDEQPSVQRRANEVLSEWLPMPQLGGLGSSKVKPDKISQEGNSGLSKLNTRRRSNGSAGSETSDKSIEVQPLTPVL